MKSWLDTYPHKIYASVLVFEGRVVDYKIGQNYWEDVYNVTLRGEISIANLFKSKVKHTFWEVNSEEKHQEVFNTIAKKWIEKQND